LAKYAHKITESSKKILVWNLL